MFYKNEVERPTDQIESLRVVFEFLSECWGEICKSRISKVEYLLVGIRFFYQKLLFGKKITLI